MVSEREGMQLQDNEYSVSGHRRYAIGQYLGVLTTIPISLLPAVGVELSDLLEKWVYRNGGKHLI